MAAFWAFFRAMYGLGVSCPAGSIFQYECPFRKKWIDCSVEEDEVLKSAFEVCHEQPIVEYDVRMAPFKVDFSRMQRSSKSSSKTMPLRLDKGELPFAPPEPVAEGTTVEMCLEAARAKPRKYLTKYDDLPAAERAKKKKNKPKLQRPPGFKFDLLKEDQENFGSMFAKAAELSGIELQTLDGRMMTLTDCKGKVAYNDHKACWNLMNGDNYPITVLYEPDKCVITGDMVAHSHQRRQFDRYLIRYHDWVYQQGDDFDPLKHPSPAHITAQNPEIAQSLTMAVKVGMHLHEILKGEVDILEMLFGTD